MNIILNKRIIKHIGNNKWFHGTTLHGWRQICSIGIKSDHNIGNELDFGYGFYLMPSREQAEFYITKLLEYNVDNNLGIPTKKLESKKIPIIIEFDFCPLDWYQEDLYSFGFFDKYDDNFADFVFHNRVNNLDGSQQHRFDIIFGVMSDNVPTILIQRYKNGEISKEEVLAGLKKSTSVKQISLHKQEVCDIIKPTRVYYIETGKELNANDYFNK